MKTAITKLWNNVSETSTQVKCVKAIQLLDDWKAVQGIHARAAAPTF